LWNELDESRRESSHVCCHGRTWFPDIAELDRVFVSEIPKLLASVGLQVIRTVAAPTGSVQVASR